MVKKHTLFDPYGLHKTVKTTIVRGEITRVSVWKDTHGTEFDMSNGKFVKRNSNYFPFDLSASLDLHIQKRDQVVENTILAEFCALFCFFSLLAMAFVFGLNVGTTRTKSKYNLQRNQAFLRKPGQLADVF